MPDSGGSMCPTRCEAREVISLEEILRYMSQKQRDNKLSYDEVYDAFFLGLGHVGRNNLKNYLRNGPPANPRDDTVATFREAYRRAQLQTCPEYIMHKLMLSTLACVDPSPEVFARFRGGYDTWRRGRYGVEQGRLRIDLHEVAGTPYHWQEHERVVDAQTQAKIHFKYKGPVYFLARNMHLLGLGPGYIRNTKCLGVHDPREKVQRGMYLSEEYTDNNPFAARILFLHDEWLRVNRDLVTEAWVLAKLTEGTTPDGSGSPFGMYMSGAASLGTRLPSTTEPTET